MGLSVGVPVGVRVGVGVGVAVGVRVDDGVGVAVRVGVGVRVAVAVGVDVTMGVAVGDGVATRITICAVGPTLPLVSRSCTVSTESPGRNAAVAVTASQNWMTEPGVTWLLTPELSTNVHHVSPLNAWKRQAKLVSAFVRKLGVALGSGVKLGGLIPGIPPPPDEAGPDAHCALIGMAPRSCVLSICRSGRLLGGTGRSRMPGVAALGPPSTTIRNCPTFSS